MTLTTLPKFELSFVQQELLEKTMAYERASLSPNTVRSYKSMWKKFEGWCVANNLTSLPATAETISLYIADLGETVSFSTLDSTLAAIEAAHEKTHQTIKGDQTLYRRVRKGIRRTHKENQSLKQAPALTLLNLKVVCCNLGNTIANCRDKAIMTLAFFGAFRRSEIASLNIDNLEFSDKGVTVSLLQSKTSDTKQTIYVAQARDKDICPVKALKEWLVCLEKHKSTQTEEENREKLSDKERDTRKALFRSLLKGGKLSHRISGHAISDIIKRHFGEEYSGHSTRRGLATAAADAKTPIHLLKKFGRWKGADMPLRYMESANGFEDSAVAVLGV
jgi:site-specific recombinase XerD